MSDLAKNELKHGGAQTPASVSLHFSTQEWIESLPTVRLAKARKLISDGSQLKIFLEKQSGRESPLWRATILDPEGQFFALSGTDISKPRKLTSVQLVYQVARNLCVPDVQIPVVNFRHAR